MKISAVPLLPIILDVSIKSKIDSFLFKVAKRTV